MQSTHQVHAEGHCSLTLVATSMASPSVSGMLPTAFCLHQSNPSLDPCLIVPLFATSPVFTGDAEKATQAFVNLAKLSDPPLHLTLYKDYIVGVKRKIGGQATDVNKYEV